MWSVEKMQKVKTQNFLGQKAKEYCFYQNVQCVVVKNQYLSNSKKLEDY